MDIDLNREPLGVDKKGAPVFLKDVWPSAAEVSATIASSIDSGMFRHQYGKVFDGDERWQSLAVPKGNLFAWDPKSEYVKAPPFFDGIGKTPAPLKDIAGARVLALLGDSVTTDHISPAGNIAEKSPAGEYLIAHGIQMKDFNSYGARRGNHEVMVRGTFANIRLRNLMVPGVEGGFTAHLPDGEKMTIFEASERYRKEGVALIVIAGKEYGTGSSRDWAAKGTQLLGVRAVIAESFERIHRSNLVGMGVLAAGVHRRPKSRIARAHRSRGLLDRGPRRGIEAPTEGDSARGARTEGNGVRNAGADRHARRCRVHQAWRHLALDAARVAARVRLRLSACVTQTASGLGRSRRTGAPLLRAAYRESSLTTAGVTSPIASGRKPTTSAPRARIMPSIESRSSDATAWQ